MKLMENSPTYKTYDLDALDKIIEIYDRDIIESLGLEVSYDGSVTCACPIHNGDNPRAFTYSPSIRRWGCWTHHCHKKWNNGLVGLVRGIKNCDFNTAVSYIMKVTGQELGEVNNCDLIRKAYIRSKTRDSKKLKIQYQIFDRKLLENKSHSVEYFLQRGFSPEILTEFEAFYCDKAGKPLYGRACLPICNINGDIVGFTGRKTTAIDPYDNNELIAKWIHLPQGIRTTNYLFGIDKAKNHIEECGVACLVEGPLDVIRMHESGVKNVVSTLSNNLSDTQRKLLLKTGVRTIISLYDPDEGGDIGTRGIINQARLYFNVHDLRSFLTGDPGDMSIEDIKANLIPEINRIISMEKVKYGK